MRFLLVDEILSLEPGRFIQAAKTMPADEALFLDHFPGFPVVPGVLLVEMMGQTAAKCLHAAGTERGLAMLIKINQATFRDWVCPGQLIAIHAEITTNRVNFATADCHISVDGQHRASAELRFGFTPLERFAPTYRDLVLEEYLRRRLTPRNLAGEIRDR